MKTRLSLLPILLALPIPSAFAETNKIPEDVSVSASCECEARSCVVPKGEMQFDRVKIRPAHQSEIPQIRELVKDPDVIRNYCLNTEVSEEEACWFEERLLMGPRDAHFSDWGPARAYAFVIEDLATHKMVGIGNIVGANNLQEWELGYAVLKDYRRQGFASEVVRGLIKFVRANNEHGQIAATPLETNHLSQELLRGIGFRREHAPNFEPNPTNANQTYFVYRF